MATAASVSFSFSGFGQTITVPDDDIARLMYYLHSVTVSLGIDLLQDDLVDFHNYHRLSAACIAIVFRSAVEFSPDIFIDKLIFKDDDGGIIPNGSSNKFVDITADYDLVSIDRGFFIGGQVKDVTKVMFYRSSWLKTYYTDPLERIAKTILGTKHCSHCEGTAGMCACSTCPRGSDSQCKPIFESFFDLLLLTESLSSSSSSAPARALAPSSYQHRANCDGCGWQHFTGPRFKCNQCRDYDLCDTCYAASKHIDTRHDFRRYERPDDSPTYLPVRSVSSPTQPLSYQHRANCDGCGWQHFTGPRFKCNQCRDYDLCEGCYTGSKHIDTGHDFRRYERPDDSPTYLPVRSVSYPNRPPPQYQEVIRTANANPFVSLRDHTPVASSPNANPPVSEFFYQSMSISELKAFLTGHDIDVRDILDKETLCKRVWETHCDCMSISELNTFLSSKNISTAGCRSINDRRLKAKAAYQPPPRPPVSRGGGTAGWRKDDIVVLMGLNKADMNGKVGTIQNVDTAAQKVTVWVDDLTKSFKVKYENVMPYVEELEGDLPDEPEELE